MNMVVLETNCKVDLFRVKQRKQKKSVGKSLENIETACAGIFFRLFRFVIVMSSDKADFVCLPGSFSFVTCTIMQ